MEGVVHGVPPFKPFVCVVGFGRWRVVDTERDWCISEAISAQLVRRERRQVLVVSISIRAGRVE